jgi:hypothetical protein
MIEQLDSTLFDWQKWRAGSIADLNILCREVEIFRNKRILKEFAIGYCYGENLPCRPKANTMAIMFFKGEIHFWFHLRDKEFKGVFCET